MTGIRRSSERDLERNGRLPDIDCLVDAQRDRGGHHNYEKKTRYKNSFY